ncbi:M20/M25/M40 family metallo-hydrolase [Aggregatimonas sangjinii]|uniref:M20/M25/M40 family metallo-hydrolase n=2 Tax=Aggregatimonas sangjinii TaxID=2583587 RepID=A0A5B7SU99_9FLAO|nr:M20/M25/M40 family metallo-hydrolase [Aggregatimonas sangjinii]
MLLCIQFVLVIGQAQESSPVAQKKYTKEIEKLSAKKVMQTAFSIIDAIDGQTTEDLIALTEIEAPPFKEGARATAFKTLLKQTELDTVWIDAIGNVIGLRKGADGDRVVVLDAHLDTVFPEGTDVTVKQKGDTLYAPGIGDDTRGLAMLVAISKAMNIAALQTKADIWFVGSVGEEGLGDLRGVKHLFRENAPKIASWIAIDGGAIGRVNNAGLGSTRYKAVFKGKGGHSWGAFGLANPHHALGYAITHFTKEAKKYIDEGPKTSFNIGRIGGGTSVNSIPFESWMEVDMRSVDAERLLEMDRIFKESMHAALEEYNASGVDDEISLELIKIGDRPSGELPETTPLVQRAIAATLFFDEQPRLTRGSTNGNIPISLGIPAVTLGRGGNGGGAHSLGEWWINENGTKAIKLALLIAMAEAGLGK